MGSTIVGVTDSSTLGQLDEAFSAALFLSPAVPTSHTHHTQQESNAGQGFDISEAMKSAAAAPLVTLTYSGSSKMESVGVPIPSLCVSYKRWILDGCKLSQLVVRQGPTGYNIRKLLLKVRSLPSEDRVLLGDMLLRENLRFLTLGFFKPGHGADSDGTRVGNLSSPSTSRLSCPSEDDVLGEAIDLLTDLVLSAGLAHALSWALGLPAMLLLTMLMLLRPFPPIAAIQRPGRPRRTGVGGVRDSIRGWPQVLTPMQRVWNRLFVSSPRPTSLPPPSPPSSSSSTSPEVAGVEGQGALSNFHPFQSHAPLEVPSPHGDSALISSSNRGSGPRAVDLTGVWKRFRSENFDKFMVAQFKEMGYLQRTLIKTIAMTHTITMSDDLTVMRLREQFGPVDVDNTSCIGGPVIHTYTGTPDKKTDFEDQASWEGGDDGGGVCRLKILKTQLPDRSYEIVSYRELVDDGKTMKTSLLFRDLKGSEGEVQAYNYFRYAGPSPHPRPTSFHPPG